jgi:hypothetical protein
MAKKLYQHGTHPQSDPYLDTDGFTARIPAVALQWLYRYQVTDKEIHDHGICWNPAKDCLVLPVFDGSRLVVTNSRYFGDNPDHPKYVTKGYKNQHFKLFPRDGNTLVLCEDYLSALRVGRKYSAIPLLGAHVPLDLVLPLLGRYSCILVWLDPDKRLEAIKAANRISQYISSRAVLSDRDPKEYTDEEIARFVSSAAGQQRVCPAHEASLQGSEA